MRAASLDEGFNFCSTPGVLGLHAKAALHCLQAGAFATAIATAYEVDMRPAVNNCPQLVPMLCPCPLSAILMMSYSRSTLNCSCVLQHLVC